MRDIAGRLVITKGKKKGQHPFPATVLRMLRDHDHDHTTSRSDTSNGSSDTGQLLVQADRPVAGH
ncbi:hypothetical protein ACQP2U_24160 [Nocardia sp. CA-084685]|uniref:hypothetical protein n=1 Tax=Nocardia sp. CA-084685 TaxID=3239970 RepID=UPI003D983EFD